MAGQYMDERAIPIRKSNPAIPDSSRDGHWANLSSIPASIIQNLLSQESQVSHRIRGLSHKRNSNNNNTTTKTTPKTRANPRDSTTSLDMMVAAERGPSPDNVTLANFYDVNRNSTTCLLRRNPENPEYWFQRAEDFQRLGYPDLAVADAYRALALLEKVADHDIDSMDSDEEDEAKTVDEYLAEMEISREDDSVADEEEVERRKGREKELEERMETITASMNEAPTERLKSWLICRITCMRLLAECLITLDCLRDAVCYLTRAEAAIPPVRRYEGIIHFLNRKKGKIDYGDEPVPRGNLARHYGELNAEVRDQILAHPDFRWAGIGQDADKEDHDVSGNLNQRPDEVVFVPSKLPELGLAPREIYKWNDHEPDRHSQTTVDALNKLIEPVATDLIVKTVELPILTPKITTQHNTPSDSQKSLQLGLFARKQLTPESIILREPSLLTAILPLNAPLCSTCGSSLPPNPILCPTCPSDAESTPIFCSQACLDLAVDNFHFLLCDVDPEIVDPLELLGREGISSRPAEDLYFLLLVRVLTIAEQRNTHPLDLDEVKYLFGEFTNPEISWTYDRHHEKRMVRDEKTLPFTMLHNIILPQRFLALLETVVSAKLPSLTSSPVSSIATDSASFQALSPPLLSTPTYPRSLTDTAPPTWTVRCIDNYDTWVIQTLYAKFRAVASARQSTWDGRPEVAAVHPLWCLANHSCSPNVGWSWGGERRFEVRRERPGKGAGGKGEIAQVEGGGGGEGEGEGIEEGEEILSHYCDVDLDVRQRREYMLGSLGGECMCERCVLESGNGSAT